MIVVKKKDIDKVFDIINGLPIKEQAIIIYTWLASESNDYQYIYKEHAEEDDTNEYLETIIDAVKEILTHDVL